jgi:hypothetical protein
LRKYSYEKKELKTPVQANYRILDLIEQMVDVAPMGTDLGLCDLVSAMFSGYFIESGGAVTPAVEAFLRQKVKDEKEREARTRRAAKSLTYGSYNLKELIDRLPEIVQQEGCWEPIVVQEYQVVPVDFTTFSRPTVKKLKAKEYVTEAGKAVPGIPIGMVGIAGRVNGQRIVFLKNVTLANLAVNDVAERHAHLYKQVKKELARDELAVFDAGFSLAGAVKADILQCLIRLPKNCTFGRTPGKIPERKSNLGRPPTRHQAEIVRPLAREHGGKTLPATEADTIYIMENESGAEIEVHIWEKVYFLERHLDDITDERQKKKLRKIPLKVMAIYDPNYDNPLLLGTPLLTLQPEAAAAGYAARWPIEGLPQAGKYILSGGGGTHYVHHLTAMQRLPVLALVFGSLLKYAAATLPPFRTGFWDRQLKPTYGRLLRHLKKVDIALSGQLCKKGSITAHLPVGYDAIRLARA